jgi:hypothetical protein
MDDNNNTELQVRLPLELNHHTKLLVVRFAEAMANKLAAAERKYGYSTGWTEKGWLDECRVQLCHHLAKGDPRDVANYCAFLWWHNEPTVKPLDERANLGGGLSFSALREANTLRLPQFKNPHGELAHQKPDGSDWSPSQWLQALVGELGEFANVRKKFERGDLTFEQYRTLAEKDLLARRALDVGPRAHETGVDLGEATRQKFNEVSHRVRADVFIDDAGNVYGTQVVTHEPGAALRTTGAPPDGAAS